MAGQLVDVGRKPLRNLDQQGGRTHFQQPEADSLRRFAVTVLEVVRFHQPCDHGPVFVALRLLGADQVWQRQQFHRLPVHDGGGPPGPQLGELLNASELGHDVHSDPVRFRMMTAKMHRQSHLQIPTIERWNRNALGLQVSQRRLQAGQVAGIGKDHQVRIAAKLRCAV